jgi:uncharacterized protein
MRRFAWAALAALLVAAPAAAQSALPPLPLAPNRYFTDSAGLVDAGTALRLNEKLRQFDQQTSTQVVVVVMAELPWPSLEDFTARAAEAWRVGRKELDNGAILFVFVKDRAVRIEVGYGLEGALPDATAKRIIEEVIIPAFRQGNFAGGIEAGADAMMAATRGEYTAPAATPRTRRRGGGGSILLIVVILLLVNWMIGRNMSRGRYTTYGRRGRRSGWGGPVYWGGGGWGGRGGGWGGGGFGGGGGFSGGGGSFGGGGASGRW